MNIHVDKPKENAVSIQRQESQSMANPNFQKKSNSKSIFQFKDNRSNSTKQLKIQEIANNSRQVGRTAQLQSAANNYSTRQQSSIHKTIPTTKQEENKTGIPDNLKSGIENLSGLDMSDVKVHYNSPQPAQLQAHAFAQGNQIHIASGQERHLPHEAWHVVQQKQGRVAPTKQLKSQVNINDDAGLEKEADIMGAKALQLKKVNQISQSTTSLTRNNPVIQRVISIGSQRLDLSGIMELMEKKGISLHVDLVKKLNEANAVFVSEEDFINAVKNANMSQEEILHKISIRQTDIDKFQYRFYHRTYSGLSALIAYVINKKHNLPPTDYGVDLINETISELKNFHLPRDLTFGDLKDGNNSWTIKIKNTYNEIVKETSGKTDTQLGLRADNVTYT